MQDRVRHHLLITIEVLRHMRDKVRHLLHTVIKTRLLMQDKVEHQLLGGTESYNNNGLEHQYLVNFSQLNTFTLWILLNILIP